MVSEARTKLGACDVLAQNPHTGIINLGHNNGTVTFWSPTVSQPHVKLLAHHGPVRAVAVDPSTSGNYMATSGADGRLKVWDIRTWSAVNEWKMPTPSKTIAFSQKGLLGVGWGNHVSVRCLGQSSAKVSLIRLRRSTGIRRALATASDPVPT
jgi:U3 small nucleolar RNA-associated protein 7